MATKGPAIIVLPGEVKSNNATFSQRYGPNNIADYAELELSQANFQVLDRANLGSVLREIEFAYNLGDPAQAQALFLALPIPLKTLIRGSASKAGQEL